MFKIVNLKKRFEPPIIAETCSNMLSYLFYDTPNHLKIYKLSKSHKCLLLMDMELLEER
jgi:hypothetical protein